MAKNLEGIVEPADSGGWLSGSAPSQPPYIVDRPDVLAPTDKAEHPFAAQRRKRAGKATRVPNA